MLGNASVPMADVPFFLHQKKFIGQSSLVKINVYPIGFRHLKNKWFFSTEMLNSMNL